MGPEADPEVHTKTKKKKKKDKSPMTTRQYESFFHGDKSVWEFRDATKTGKKKKKKDIKSAGEKRILVEGPENRKTAKLRKTVQTKH